MMEIIPTNYEVARALPKDSRVDKTIEQIIQGVYADEEALAMWSNTLIEDGKILAVIGLRPLWPRVAEAWTFISDEARARPLSLVRATKGSLEEAAPRLGLRRIQALGEVIDPKIPRWFKALGFEQEGVLRNYGINGEGDYYMYARIF